MPLSPSIRFPTSAHDARAAVDRLPRAAVVGLMQAGADAWVRAAASSRSVRSLGLFAAPLVGDWHWPVLLFEVTGASGKTRVVMLYRTPPAELTGEIGDWELRSYPRLKIRHELYMGDGGGPSLVNGDGARGTGS